MKGTVVAVTGMRRGTELAEAFARRDATVLHVPMLSGDHPAPEQEVIENTRLILEESPQWIVATTGVGMRLWFEVLERAGLLPEVQGLMQRGRCIARSAKAAAGLVIAGPRPEWTARRETDATVVGWLAQHALEDDGVAIQLHGGRPRAYDALARSGRDVMSVMPYRTGPPLDADGASQLVEVLLEGGIDVLTFTSPGAVRNVFTVADEQFEDGARRLAEVTADRTAVAAVGPVTAGTCEDLGMLVRMQPARYRSLDLVREVETWLPRGRSETIPKPVQENVV